MSEHVLAAGVPYRKPSVESGRQVEIECIDIDGRRYRIERGRLTTVRLDDEWFEDVDDPHAVVDALARERRVGADLFSFWQRLPDVAPRFDFAWEAQDLAVLPISSYEHWWTKQIKSRTRSLIRSAGKKGVEVRETSYDDDFVRGMTRIFNEAPLRQGRPFWHYGKDFATVKHQFSRFVHRERMIGAYYEDTLIGLVMLGNAGHFGLTGQVISSLDHRDKAVNNALIAKTVEVCASLGLEHLAYFFWSNDSLAEFKRRNGFQKVAVPRYYVPLSRSGRIAMRLGAHRGWKAMLPTSARESLKQLRNRWHATRSRGA